MGVHSKIRFLGGGGGAWKNNCFFFEGGGDFFFQNGKKEGVIFLRWGEGEWDPNAH